MPNKSKYAAVLTVSTLMFASHLYAASLTIEEEQAGFCSVDGTVDSNNEGFLGDGFANTANVVGSTIEWRVNAATSGNYRLHWRYANGSTANRPGNVLINGSERGTVDLPSTAAWVTYANSSVIDVSLNAGSNTVILQAIAPSGLANIDNFTVDGDSPSPGACDGSATPIPTLSPTPTPTSSPTPAPNANPLVTGCGTETSNLSASKIYYVSANASDSGSGSSFAQPMSLGSALDEVSAGEMVLLEPGIYRIDYSEGNKNTIVLSQHGTKNSPIYMVAANCGRAVVDFSFPEQAWVQNSYGFELTGDFWYFKGIEVTRAGYQGVYVTGNGNTFENCAFHNNRNTGLEINKGGSNTTVINSDAYRNYDPKKNGSMADGFGPKQTQGAGNKFYGCRAWENSDDGFDTYDSDQAVVIDSSWAFRNGIDIWGYGVFEGNGNGFKLGGNFQVQRNIISRSVAFGQPNKGFDQNNNAGGVQLYNNTAYDNGVNYGFCGSVDSGERHEFRNNVSLSGDNDVCNASASNNSWDSNVAASSSDFENLDTGRARVNRNPDGTLPDNGLFRLRSSSDLIDAGADVGLVYKGSAPDLGAFERE